MRPLLTSLLFLAVVCLGCFAAVAADTPRLRDDSARYLFELVNQERVAVGLMPLAWDNALAVAAERHAERMAANGSISHQYAGEPDLPERFGAEGARFSAAAENVALNGTVNGLHSAWMHSPGHRANILDTNMTELGVAVVKVNGRMYAVEDFARGVASVPLDEQERRVGRMVAARGLALAPYREEARRVCEGGRVARGERRPMFTMHYTTQDLALLPRQLTDAAASGRYRDAVIGACDSADAGSFSTYHLVVLLF
jgi:hypothetical protein